MFKYTIFNMSLDGIIYLFSYPAINGNSEDDICMIRTMCYCRESCYCVVKEHYEIVDSINNDQLHWNTPISYCYIWFTN